jgi:hypothetical protein
MTTTGFIILFILITVAVLIFIEIGGLPGRQARERDHPNADAISLLGWLGLPFGGVGWLVAMVWARVPIFPMKIVDGGDVDEAQVDTHQSE